MPRGIPFSAVEVATIRRMAAAGADSGAIGLELGRKPASVVCALRRIRQGWEPAGPRLTEEARERILNMTGTIAEIMRETGFGHSTIDMVRADARDAGDLRGFAKNQREHIAAQLSGRPAQQDAPRHGREGAGEACPAVASIPADPIAASLWMRGIRGTGEAQHQARLQPVRVKKGAREVAASPARVVQSKGPFRLALHDLNVRHGERECLGAITTEKVGAIR